MKLKLQLKGVFCLILFSKFIQIQVSIPPGWGGIQPIIVWFPPTISGLSRDPQEETWFFSEAGNSHFQSSKLSNHSLISSCCSSLRILLEKWCVNICLSDSWDLLIAVLPAALKHSTDLLHLNILYSFSPSLENIL